MALSPMDCVMQTLQLAMTINDLRAQAHANEVNAMTTLDPDIKKVRTILGKIQSAGRAPDYIADSMKDLHEALKDAEALIRSTLAKRSAKKAFQVMNRVHSADKRKAELQKCEKRVHLALDYLMKCLHVDVWVDLCVRRRDGEGSQPQQLVDLSPVTADKASFASLCLGDPVKLATGLSRDVGPLRRGRVGVITKIQNNRYEVCAKYERTITDWFAEEELLLLEQDPLPPFVNMLDVVVVAAEYDDAPNVQQGLLGTTPDQAGIVLSHDGALGGQMQVIHISSGNRHSYDAAHLSVLEGDEHNSVVQHAARRTAGIDIEFVPGDIVMLTEDRDALDGEALDGPLTEPYSIGIVEPLSREERQWRDLLDVHGIVKVRAAGGQKEYLYEEMNLQLVLRNKGHASTAPTPFGLTACATCSKIPYIALQ